ncbi:DNA polymerase III subunit gamma/tau [Alteribacillus iranensis]|uniref:DNA-directed DNA polymerase n=1 Tax=Alteribacillus iranensis TaxID=930128 RepID=A0A1I2C843_9BACI|nr:DNA polymerase III subunit gamma/tau [Alteribacillus iranensis]SFE63983.1 DNA polymerase-3 subunit gamma/tau [Alteribacillus iranensis]
MSYKALYRVWRPQSLEDVTGQKHITTTLQNALVEEKFSHAYLFSGPRGTGKTSAAKIIAKAVNCEHAPIKEPCNECRACRGISDGSVVDVIEIDAASNNGVDEIRYIRENVIAAPRDVRYKVYIIDEVHMLSTGAFNALLKTLEEPPKHAIFILATTEPHKIPLTIISRCQRFDFKRITTEDIVDRMKYILAEQGWEAEEEALYLIARAAEGGMRDALSLLDQAVSFSTDVVQAGDVLAITGAVSQQFLTKVVTALREKDTASALEAANSMIQEGKDPLQFMEDLIYYFRDMLLYQTAPELDEVLNRVTVDESFRSLAEETSSDWLYEIIHRLNEHHQEMKWASHPKIFLEMALIHICQSGKQQGENDSNAQVTNKELTELKTQLSELKREVKHWQEQAPKESETNKDHVPKATSPSRENTSRKIASTIGGNKRAQGIVSEATKKELQLVQSSWADVMKLVKQQSVPAHAWLSDAKPVVSNGTEVLLAFQNEMHRNMVDTKFREMVDQSLTETCGKPLHIVTILAPQWEKLKEAYKKGIEGESGENGDEKEGEDPIIDEAIKLVGEDLVEIIEEK